MKIKGILVDIHKKETYPASFNISRGRIKGIRKEEHTEKVMLIPGLIDAHIHIESSMLTPGFFAMAAVSRGTTAVISDPHEIANVLGYKGIMYMIKDGRRTPLKFYFGAPSCVPATNQETSGANIGANEIKRLLRRNDILYLAEMMNYPGVIYGDKEVLEKIQIAKKAGKRIDGHAPGLRGEMLKKYIAVGISTDHECSTLDEAKEKAENGMKILIREGSAARNLDAIKEMIRTDPEKVMLCSDDLHPEMLKKRHLDQLIAGLIKQGFDKYDVLRSVSLNPVKHYGINSGLLREGDPADFVIVDDIETMNVLETWIDGKKVYDRGKILFKYRLGRKINIFNSSLLNEENIKVKNSRSRMRIIEAFDGELLTRQQIADTKQEEYINADTEGDILKIVVKDRYRNGPPAVAFIKGFGLKKGAFAGSVAHDSHNIICVGTNDYDITKAINEIIRLKGGLAVVNGSIVESLQLPVAGIMSDKPLEDTARDYEHLSARVKEMGCTMSAPFMTLSFMALLVIPELKLSDKGLFNGKEFNLVPLFC